MKKRILPFGIFSFLIFGLVALFFFTIDPDKSEDNQVRQGKQSIKGAKEYLAAIRNNQNTGILNPNDVIKARQQIDALASYKSSSDVSDLEWEELGPNNIGGRTRAIIFDNQDETAKTLYAGSVTGGIFKSVDLGASWEKINLSSGTANLNVSCMVQDDDGTIYVGTGEGLSTENYSALGDFGFEGGFVGRGLFKSDGGDNFNHIEGTAPAISEELGSWAYVNKLAIDKNANRLYAATNNGLQYASLPGLSNWYSNCRHLIDTSIVSRTISRDSIIVCDSFEISGGNFIIYGQSDVEVYMTADDTTDVQTVNSTPVLFEEYGNCYDVKVSDNGYVIASFNNFIYVSENGDPSNFVLKSIYPENPDNVRKDNLAFSTHVIIKNKSNSIIHEEIKTSTEVKNWHTNYVYIDELESKWAGFPSSENMGRLSYAIAPSNQNVVYAMSEKHNAPYKHRLYKIYLSKDGGDNWMTIADGEFTGTNNYLNILGSHWTSASGVKTYYYQGDYNNTLTVFPNDPFRVIAGGVNMWEGYKVSETGYYQWEEKSIGNANAPILNQNGNLDQLYCHVDHHTYVFRPGTTNELVVGTDGGIYYATYYGFYFSFQVRNKNYNATQFYSVDVSTRQKEFIGGTQDNGTIYVSGEGNRPKKGEDMWRPANLDPKFPEGTDGGFVAVSNSRMVKPGIEEVDPPSVYSRSDLPDLENNVKTKLRRSESLGYDYSNNFFEGYESFTTNNFMMPLLLWESYNNELSLDSITFFADDSYEQGDIVMVRSNNFNHPFMYELPVAMSNGDSLRVQDIISARVYFAINDEVWMSCQGIRFNVTAQWNLISTTNKAGFTGTPSSMAISADGNYLWVGNMDGKLYRISNMNYVCDSTTADVNSSSCMIATSELDVYEENTQVITSIAVDPLDGNKVIVTLGNYGNEEFVFYTEDALSDIPTFTSVQGNLPQMPVYSAVLEMGEETDIAIIGTEEGLWMSDDVTTGEWYDVSGSIGKVPVMDLKQQWLFKPRYTVTFYDPGTGQPLYEIYEATDNYGLIYAATHGRGVFMNDLYYTVGVDELPQEESSTDIGVQIYPNPASDNISISFDQPNKSGAFINIYDLGGKLVRSESQDIKSSGTQKVQLNISSLARGTYVLNVVVGDKTGTTKLVIIK